MSTAVPFSISIEEYLHSSYSPDCEFIDGRLEQRTGGESEHALLFAAVGGWFFNFRYEWKIRVAASYRICVSPTRVRIPDICIVPHDGVKEKVRITPPILCIEILSPEDHLDRLFLRLKDFLMMGVSNLWFFDPIERAAFTYTADGLLLAEGTRLSIEDFPIYLDLPEIFSALD